MSKMFEDENGKIHFSEELQTNLSEIHGKIKNIIGNYNRKSFFKKNIIVFSSLFFPEIWTSIFSTLLFIFLGLSITLRLIDGPVFFEGEIKSLRLFVATWCYISLNFLWLFRYLIHDKTRYTNIKNSLGLDTSSRTYNSLIYSNYSLREKDLLDGRINITEKRKILFELSSFDPEFLRFAEQHYAYLESISKKEENLAITIIVVFFGVLINIAYSYLLSAMDNSSITWIDQGQFLIVFSTLCVTFVRRSFQLDSLGTRFEVCVNLLRQAQVLNQASKD